MIANDTTFSKTFNYVQAGHEKKITINTPEAEKNKKEISPWAK